MRWKPTNIKARRWFTLFPEKINGEYVWLEWVYWKCSTRNEHHKTCYVPCMFADYYNTLEEVPD